MNATKRFSSAVVLCTLLLAVAACPAYAALVVDSLVHLPGEMHLQVAGAHIYSDTANAKEEIRQAILKAANEHKRVILDFGGNWCEDCQVLNIYFHEPGNASLLATNFVLVDVNVGEYDKNLDLARKYGIPLNRGVPALVVLDSSGRVLFAQRNAEFEKMRKLDSSVVTAFLGKWKPQQRARPHRMTQQKAKSSRATGA